MTDKSLLELLETDPEAGVRQLKAQFSKGPYHIVRLRIQGEADIEDCIEDTLTDFYLQRRQFDPSRGTIKAYLATMADRKAIHKFQDIRQQWQPSEEEQPFRQDALDHWEDHELLHEALHKLPMRDRQIVEMKYYGGYSTREIAQIQGMQYETVKKRLQRVCKKLQQIIEQQGG